MTNVVKSDGKRLTYPETSAPLRTDEDFRLQTNCGHHNGVSPFCSLPVNMIDFFPIDYMHQTCLGVTKRLLVCLTSSKKVKLSASNKLAVNVRLETFKQVITSDFSRKPRPINEMTHWKATEFRTFLLYSGYFVLYKIVKAEILDHFLCLSVALRILVSERLAADNNLRSFAHELLVYFVSKSVEIYGNEFLVYNVHCLTHLKKEVDLYGSLNSCSAFPFENFLQLLKKMARSGNCPVIQVYNHRLYNRLYKFTNVNCTAKLKCERLIVLLSYRILVATSQITVVYWKMADAAR